MTKKGKKSKKSRKFKIPVIPRVSTTACRSFFMSWNEINEFLDFVTFMAVNIDQIKDKAHKVLAELEDAILDEENKATKKKVKEKTDKTKTAIANLAKFRQFFMEVILVRHIENYLNYISSLLFEIFVQRPEAMRSSEKIEIQEILRHDSFDSMIRAIAEKKVASLSYESFQELNDYFQGNFGLELYLKDRFSEIVEAIEIRNISVHNRCIISKRYAAKVACDASKIGKQKVLGIDYLRKIVPALSEAVSKIDKSARCKLKLAGKRFPMMSVEHRLLLWGS